MALKFLNKKGWHTGSLRNIENVWKAEQKHEAEKRKLEELKKQIHEEREAQEFRLLQEQAGLVPKQERLEFLYDSGLAVGRSSTDDYLLGKPLEEKKGDDEITKVAGAPGALFVEEKPQSANDAWRKLHTDPLLLIRQQEQAALARIKNNPVKMDLIKKSVEKKIVKKDKRRQREEREKKQEEKRRKGKHMQNFPILNEPKGCLETGEGRNAEHTSREGKQSRCDKRHESSQRMYMSPERRSYDRPEERQEGSGRMHYCSSRHADLQRRHVKLKKRHDSPDSFDMKRIRTSANMEHTEKRTPKLYSNEDSPSNQMERSKQIMKHERKKLTDEERAVCLKEMQNDAEVHEEQRWHRLKKASDADQLEEASRQSRYSGKNFVNETAKSIYGAAKGGSTSVEESVRRRTHFIERSIGDSNSNTFQRL